MAKADDIKAKANAVERLFAAPDLREKERQEERRRGGLARRDRERFAARRTAAAVDRKQAERRLGVTRLEKLRIELAALANRGADRPRKSDETVADWIRRKSQFGKISRAVRAEELKRGVSGKGR